MRRVFVLSVLSALGVFATTGLGCSDSSGEGGSSGATPDGGVPGDARPNDDGASFDAASIPACLEASGKGASPIFELTDDTGKASVVVSGAGCERTFELSSTAARRDDLPVSPRTVVERAGTPSLQTGNDLFDALYQLALDEASQASVAAIQDGAFQNGAPLACEAGGCFETGRKWTYVWTRDTAYAVDLGIGWLDPVRAKNSLDFKLSTRRDGTDLQIVQDTGTGGSYPVSTDRVVWALGAKQVLDLLSGDARVAYRDRALTAIKNTLAHDRVVAFDPADGLYRGEQSFLDWRDQTYPEWSVPDTVTIATSKSLSTNVLHLAAMDIGAALAEEAGDGATASDLRAKASALRTAIKTRLWLDEDKQFSTFVTTDLDAAPARRWDLLGTSLAVLFDVGTESDRREAIASYPTLPKGPPVIFPQQKDTPIYHNRAIWPFVTAYWARAAKKVGNGAAFDNAVASLVRGAALNLSNMENFEVVTGKPYLADGAASGPVVNSQRQLWSVAGYIDMVHGGVFGVSTSPKGLVVAPFVTKELRRTTFANADSIALNNLPLRGRTYTLQINLPKVSDGGGAYGVGAVRLNGAFVPGGVIDDAALGPRNLIEVDLVEPTAGAASLKVISDVADYRSIFAPKTPSIASVALSGGKITLSIGIGGEAAGDVTVSVYRDGVRVAKDLAGSTTSWQDADSNGEASPSRCYTVETRYVASGNVSQRARPACFWGSGAARITTIGAGGFTVVGGSSTNAYGKSFYESWGDPGHTITAQFTAQRTGTHLVQAVYGNGSGALSTGITCAVKRVDVEELDGTPVASGYMMMPQRADWASWGDSSFVRANLVSGKQYRVRLSADARSVNMSAFSHFATYTGGTGGTGGAFSRVNVAELKVLSLAP